MTVKHTPKPWFINTNSDECLIGKLSVESTGGYYICQVDESVGQEANARLIAAAPDLLEALQGMIEVVSNTEYGEIDRKLAVKDARAAIAKATYKEP